MSNALEVNNLNKEYIGFSLKDVRFSVPEGYIMGFIGPNGSGKTTTIKCILNMVNYSGEINLFGEDNKTEGINDGIGIVTDSPLYVDDWKITDVEAAVSPFYRNWDGVKYSELISRFGIEKTKKVKELSKGMKIKLMLAVALSHDARLLILDEPTSGLDPVARDELCELLLDFVSDDSHSVLFSTHIITDLEKIADYITFIQNGEIMFTGLKDDLADKYIMVKGGAGELNLAQKKLIIGLREHISGFEGMVELSDAEKLPKSVLIEKISLEDIVVFMNRGGNK